MNTITTLTLEEVKELLSKCHLHISKDRYFGDAEYHWTSFDDSRAIAEGYFGGGDATINLIEHTNRYTGDEAHTLRTISYSVSVSHNDLTGE